MVYLKREHRVSRKTRAHNRLAGFGPVSRSEREAFLLQALETEGLPGPQWLAYGSDGNGRAFLIVDELPGTEMRRALPTMTEPARKAFALRAAQDLAELHAAGFDTPELAAKHVFVSEHSGSITIIDWQSARRRESIPLHELAESLGQLHATLAPEIADPHERIAFLKEYHRAIKFRLFPDLRFAEFARSVLAQANRLAARSSVRDQLRMPRGADRLVWLADEAVCVVPELVDVWPKPAICSPYYSDAPSTKKEWVRFPDGRCGILLRFSTTDPWGRFAAWIREKSWRSPAATLARIMFHAERFDIPAPKLLAFGQRFVSPIRAESFILYEAKPKTFTLASRLARLRNPIERKDLLRECGRMLRNLHDSGLRISTRDSLFVIEDKPRFGCGVVLKSPQAVKFDKRMSDRRRRADLRLLTLDLGPSSREDRAELEQGYSCARLDR